MDPLSEAHREGMSPREFRNFQALRHSLALHAMSDDDLAEEVRIRRLELLTAAAELQIGDFSHTTPEQLWGGLAMCSVEIAVLEDERRRRERAATFRQRAAANGRPTHDLADRFAAARDIDCAELMRALTGQPGRGTGRTRTFRCPLHEDNTPSLVTYPPGHGWYCFSCNQGGDAVALLTAIEPISRMDALRRLESGAIGGVAPRAVTPEAR